MLRTGGVNRADIRHHSHFSHLQTKGKQTIICGDTTYIVIHRENHFQQVVVEKISSPTMSSIQGSFLLSTSFSWLFVAFVSLALGSSHHAFCKLFFDSFLSNGQNNHAACTIAFISIADQIRVSMYSVQVYRQNSSMILLPALAAPTLPSRTPCQVYRFPMVSYT